MPDFLRPRRGLTIAEIAKLTDSKLQEGGSSDRCIRDIATLEAAGPSDLGFLDEEGRLGELARTHAGACLMAPRFAPAAPARLVVLTTEQPYAAFVLVARALFPDALRPASLFDPGEGAAGAVVHSSARVEAGVTIDPLVAIGPRAEVGAATIIAAGAAIGPDVRIGRQCAIGAGVSIVHALIGDRVILHPGVRIGQGGFAYLQRAQGPLKIPQTRRVIIQDDVEIGANTTIDRGSIGDTVIGEGTKIGNLAQIAQNVSIGRHCLLAPQSSISDGATIVDFVIIAARKTGGQVP